MKKRKFLAGMLSAFAMPALIRPIRALAYDSPTVRFNYVSGFGETATWQWINELGVTQGTASGAAGGAGLPTIPDPLTVMLQASLDYAGQNGFHYRATGRSYLPQQPNGTAGFLQTWSTINLPAVGDTKIEFDNVIWIMRPATGGPGLVFDSSELLDFRMPGGEILYRGPNAAISFRPSTRTILDNNLSINSARSIEIASVTVQCGGALLPVGSGSALAAVLFDTSLASIKWNNFGFGQVSGNNVAQYGFLAPNPAAGNVLQGNKVDVNYAMMCTQGCFQIGTSASGPAMSGNEWDCRAIMPGNAGATGFNTFGQGDFINLLSIQGPMFRGLCLEPGSTLNRYRVGIASGASSANILDAGTSNQPN